MQNMQKIKCNGPCKRTKPVFLFRPYDLRSAKPICRDCRNLRRKQIESKSAGRDRTRTWRRSAARFFGEAIRLGRAS